MARKIKWVNSKLLDHFLFATLVKHVLDTQHCNNLPVYETKYPQVPFALLFKTTQLPRKEKRVRFNCVFANNLYMFLRYLSIKCTSNFPWKESILSNE